MKPGLNPFDVIGPKDDSNTWSNAYTRGELGNFMTTDMVMSISITKIAPALLKAQKNMGAALKDAKNPFFKSKYADLNAVREASHPALNAEDIMVLQPTVQKDGRSYVRTLLVHTSGEFIGSDVEIVSAKERDPQAQGSAITYARRYGLQALVSLGAEDDDGEKAMDRPVEKKAVPATTTASFVKTTKPSTGNGWE